jgi:hypothetical protein
MNEIRQDDQCIEWETDFGPSYFFSVIEYEEGHRWAQRLSNPRARAFHDVSWTEGAPRAPKLKTDWQKTSRGRFRICDWDVYDAQMRELLGLV